MNEAEETVAIDGSDGPWIERRIVVWRRLEPGDLRTEGTELAPESALLEAKLVRVGISRDRHEELERLWKVRLEVLGKGGNWTTRYEPGGVLFALGGGLAVGAWLSYLPDSLLPLAGSLVLLGVSVGIFTRIRKSAHERTSQARWKAREERDELEAIESKLEAHWKRFSEKLKTDGFRTEVNVGDVDEADRLVSIDPSSLCDPASWRPDEKDDRVRYGAVLPGGRVVERAAELEDEAPARSEEAQRSDATRDEDDEEDGDDDGAVDEHPARDEDA